jgi:predicted signal transduction protein with EAL and GGDEF domain
MILAARSSDPDVLRVGADRLYVSPETPFELDDLSVDVRASIGGALFPLHGVDATELMRHAT